MIAKADIVTAVKHASLFIKIPELKGADIALTPKGEPIRYVGGFNMVFPATVKNKKWAFRVWHVPVDNTKKRYQEISLHLSKYKLKYFADFSFHEKGILVAGKFLDCSMMEWIEGDLLKTYIEKNLNSPQILQNLAENFKLMNIALRTNQISHGDLQEGNILITQNNSIKLIDYDSICVPSLEGTQELVNGLKGYQHPSRFSSSESSLKSDYFSELIIYLSILAIAEKPSLWKKYQVKDSNYMLFSEEDFVNFSSSKIYKDLNGLSNHINTLLNILSGYINQSSFLNLSPFITYLNPPEIELFYANKLHVTNKVPIRLRWNVKNATIIQLNKKNVTSLNSYDVIINKDTNFILTAINTIGSVYKSITITTSKEKPTIHFFKSDIPNNYIQNKAPIVLSWNISGAEKIKINNGVGNVSNLDTLTIVPPNQPLTYIITATSFFGQTTQQSLYFTINKTPPTIIQFDSSLPIVINKNNPTKLTWKVQGAEKIEIDNGIGIVTNLSFYNFTPSVDTILTLKATSYFGAVSLQKIKIKVSKAPPTIKYFNSSIALIESKNNPAKLTWDIENGEKIEINNGVGIVQNQSFVYVIPLKNTIYRLKATSYFGVSITKELEVKVSKKPPIIKYFNSSTAIVESKNNPAKLTWDIENAEVIEINNGIGLVDSQSFINIVPNQNTIYTIKATSYFGVIATKEIEIKVSKKPPIIQYFNSDKYTLVRVEEIILSWNVINAEITSIDNNIGNVESVGVATFKITKEIIFTLKATSYFGVSEEQQLIIKTVKVPPIIHYFKTSNYWIYDKKPITLSWLITNAKIKKIDNNIGNISSKGTKTVSIDKDTVFQLYAESELGGTISRIVNVCIYKQLPRVVYFYTDAKIIPLNTSTILRWKVDKSAKVEINNIIVSSSGEMVILPKKNTTYFLKAYNLLGQCKIKKTTIRILKSIY